MNSKKNQNVELVIFDCDGVLIDSELISVRVLSEVFYSNGLDISVEYIKKNFIGHSFININIHIKKVFNKVLPEDFEEKYRNSLLSTFKNELLASSGIKHVLENINVPICVATSSSLIRARSSLKIVDLFDYFNNQVYSAYNMGNRGKPQPDIYLFSAEQFKIKPENTLVIEDSLLGVQGAVNAGMKVCHYIGASHLKDWDENHEYKFQPNIVLKDMTDFFKIFPYLKKETNK